jgi:hypothetical protein
MWWSCDGHVMIHCTWLSSDNGVRVMTNFFPQPNVWCGHQLHVLSDAHNAGRAASDFHHLIKGGVIVVGII